jgi:hypothetical protein
LEETPPVKTGQVERCTFVLAMAQLAKVAVFFCMQEIAWLIWEAQS